MSANITRVERAAKRVRAQRVARPAHLATGTPTFMQFLTEPEYLSLRLYPRQATLSKLAALDVEEFTDYDYKVLREWSAGFEVEGDQDGRRWAGVEGIPGDVLERIEWCREHDRTWWRELILLIGRRGGKNYVGAGLASWRLWQLLQLDDPHAHYGISRGKKLAVLVFAGKKQQAIQNQLEDIRALLTSSPCFEPFLANDTSDCIRLYTRRQVREGETNPRRALIEIRATESTPSGPRGPAAIMVFFDEFAHLAEIGPTASQTKLYNAAEPTVRQFTRDGTIVMTSSPWDQAGQLFVSYQRTLKLDEESGTASDPDMLVVQLPSWAPYVDHDLANSIPRWPGGPCFEPPGPPIITFDTTMARHERANPDSFAVEYRAQWRSSLDAYLPKRFVDGLFAPFNGEVLDMQTAGILSLSYVAHGDPSKSQANFGFAMGHKLIDAEGHTHVLIDVIDVWHPQDFVNGNVSYIAIEDEIFNYCCRFNVTDLSFDQFNSAGTIERLQARLDKAKRPVRTRVQELTASADHNWRVYETLKTALGHGIVHAPPHSLARAELDSLQLVNGKVSTMTSGPVQTKDVADSIASVVWTLIGEDAAALFERLANTPLRGSMRPSDLVRMPKPPTVLDQLSSFKPRAYTFGAARRGVYPKPSRGIRRGR